MSALRSAAGAGPPGGLNLSDNESVIKFVALQISMGQLRICQRMARTANVSGAGSTPDDDTDKPFPLSERRKPSPATSSSGDDDPATFPEDADGQAQAATLNSAAADGTPFCAECEKKKAEADDGSKSDGAADDGSDADAS